MVDESVQDKSTRKTAIFKYLYAGVAEELEDARVPLIKGEDRY